MIEDMTKIAVKGARARRAIKISRSLLKKAKKSKDVKRINAAKGMYTKARKVSKLIRKVYKRLVKRATKGARESSRNFGIKVVEQLKGVFNGKVVVKAGTPAFKKKVKKACKFCKQNINIKNGDKKLFVIKSKKTLVVKASKIAVFRAKELLIKKKIAAKKVMKQKKAFRAELRRAKVVSKKIVSRVSKQILLTHVTIVKITELIKISSPAKKLVLKKKIISLKKKVAGNQKKIAASKTKAKEVVKKMMKKKNHQKGNSCT